VSVKSLFEAASPEQPVDALLQEMFIVKSGRVQVLGGSDGKTVICTLGEGSVFGEIALLGVGGMNKRTADVISEGFSNLYVLKKRDLESVLRDYPDARRILGARARRLMRENEILLQKEKAEARRQRTAAENDKVLFPLHSRRAASEGEPGLLKVVMEALPPGSPAVALLHRSASSPSSSAIALAPDATSTFSRVTAPDGRRRGHSASLECPRCNVVVREGNEGQSAGVHEEETNGEDEAGEEDDEASQSASASKWNGNERAKIYRRAL